MSSITLVRHGQANTEARDEVNYDQLSPLGHQQAQWLGAHLATTDATFPHILTGTLRRHVETAQSMGLMDFDRDPRFNELEYFTMSQIAEAEHNLPVPDSREAFQHHMPTLMDLWQRDALTGAPETFVQFETRVRDAMADVAARRGPALVVTSGGVVGMTLRITLDLDVGAMARACLSVLNSSVHRWIALPSGLGLAQFNTVPHLETADRRFAQTHL
ncbi:MAG: histidine phosphatase family protein [Paracoccaceae bacterium]